MLQRAARSAQGSRAFWTFWAAGATSQLGTAVTTVALPLTAVTVLDATPFEMGMVAAAGYAAWLVLGLPAGVITQRLPLRGTQVLLDLVRAAALMSVPLAWWLGKLTVLQLVAVALLISTANVVFEVANSTFLPRVVPSEDLQRRNSLISGFHAVNSLGGPGVGGVLVGWLGAPAALLADCFSYVVSALLLSTLPRSRVERPESWPPLGAMIREGFHYVARHPVMGPCMWNAAVINFVCGAQFTLFPLFLVRELAAPAAVVGLLLATEGVGALFGAVLMPRLAARLGTARLDIAGNVLSFLAAFVLPLSHGKGGWVVFGVGNALFAAGVVVGSIATRTYRQIASPPELLSRVTATVRFVSWGAIPVGSLLAGVVATTVGSRAALLLMAAVMSIAPLTLLLSRVRSLRDFDDYDEAGDNDVRRNTPVRSSA
jgi:MFS-type transporter involved in bile tolerance (Atg22 family)